MKTKKILTLYFAILITCALTLSSAFAVQNIQRDGYIDQILKESGWEQHNYLVTDWSKLDPLPDTNEGEQAVFLCMIAAQMLQPGMTWEEYFSYLEEKGISYRLQELQGPWTVGGDEVLCLLHFSPTVSLYLVDDPVQYAAISFDSPFEYGGSASISVDFNLTWTPYWTLTDKGQLVKAP